MKTTKLASLLEKSTPFNIIYIREPLLGRV
jgi:hypothetical protein